MRAELLNEEIKVVDGYLFRESLKEISGRRYDSESKSWFLPRTEANIASLKMLGAELDDALKAELPPHGDAGEAPVCDMPVSVKPYRHQILGFNRCMRNAGYGLLYQVGLGKSLTAIAAVGARYQRGEVKRLLIVCPLAVQSVWERECRSLTIDNSVRLLEGSIVKRLDMLRSFPADGLQIAVINYEGARIMADALIKWKPDMLIVDESQRIKNVQSKQAKAVHKIAKDTPYRIILTATPLGNNVQDIFSQWKVIDPSLFGNSFYSFRARYVILGGYAGREVIGYKNMPELLQKMHSKALRVTAEEALDLPEQVFESRYCSLEPRALAIYNGLKRDCVSALESGEITTTNILTQLLRLQQCAGGFLKADGGEHYVPVSTAKLDLLEDTLEDILDASEKVVVFCRFTAELDAITRRLAKKGIGHEILSGAVKDKGAAVERFQTDADIKVLVCQITVGGVGITLTAASVMLFFSTTFSLIDHLQAVGRIHRIGQSRRCLYINLLVEKSVDEHIFAAIAQKKNLSDNIVDNWREVLGKKYDDSS